MAITLVAKYVTNIVENGIAIVGFADDEFKTKHYLLLQRQLAPSEQDRRLGHDAIHIERDSPNNSAYGGINELRLEKNRLFIRLEPKTSKHVSEGQEIEVRFNLEEDRFPALREIMSQLTSGFDIFVDLTE